MTNTKSISRRVMSSVVLMTLILGFGIDLYTPAFPTIVKSLDTTNQLVQLTIATYLVGIIIGCIAWGPISDILGRKKPLVISLSIYAILSLLCGFATSISALLILRFFSGVFAAAITNNRAILGDVFSGKKLAGSMTYYTMSYRMGPIIAPLFGGYLVTFISWESIFYFLALYIFVVLILVIIFLPETHEDTTTFQPMQILKLYMSYCKNPVLAGGGICLGIYYSLMLLFNVVGPFFIENILGYTPLTFGHLAFILGIIAFMGMVINRILVQHFPPMKVLAFGVYAILVVGICQVITAFIFPVNLYSFMIPITIILFLTGFVSPNLMSHIIGLAKHNRGTISAFLGITLFIAVSTIIALSSFLKSDTSIPFSLAYFVLIVGCFLLYKFVFLRESSIK